MGFERADRKAKALNAKVAKEGAKHATDLGLVLCVRGWILALMGRKMCCWYWFA
jgi:hypothetical protein